MIQVKLFIILFILAFVFKSNDGFSQDINQFELQSGHWITKNCKTPKTIEDSICYFMRYSDSTSKVLKEFYGMCPDSLASSLNKNLGVKQIGELFVRIINESYQAVNPENKATSGKQALKYFELKGIMNDLYRKQIDEFLDSKGVYKK